MKKEFNEHTYRYFRELVLKRDKFMCVRCGASGVLEPSVELRVHLLNNSDEKENHVSEMDNAITLCNKCHDIRYSGSFHSMFGVKNNTKEQFEKWIGRNVSLV